MNNQTLPLVSIILRSLNEERWISACLDGIFSQNYKSFEVILIDNYSSDITVQKAKEYPVQVSFIENFRPGLALNQGIRMAKGEYIVCLSAHCIPKNENWLGNLVAPLLDSKVAGVYGRQEPLSFTSDIDKRDLLITFGLDKKIQYKDSFFHNANSAIKKSIWETIPFDEKVSNIEDRIWARDVLKAGYCLVYEPESSVYHYHGIHHSQEPKRCKNIIKIIESLDTDGEVTSLPRFQSNPIVNCIIPVKGLAERIGDYCLLKKAIVDAQNSKFISRIFVTTDSKDVQAYAISLGAEAPFLRDPSLSKDFIDLTSVYAWTLHELERRGIFSDLVLLAETGFPFRPINLFDSMIDRSLKGGSDSIIATRKEFTTIWKKGNDELTILNEEDTPKKYKEPSVLSLKGLGQVTYPNFIRNHSMGSKIEFFNLDHPFVQFDYKALTQFIDRQLFASMLKNFYDQYPVSPSTHPQMV